MDKVNSMIQEELSSLINELVEFPDVVFVTVKRVDVSPDLKRADVYVSLFPFGQRHRGIRVLAKAQKTLQKELGKHLSLKFTPRLKFIIDETEESMARVEELIDS